MLSSPYMTYAKTGLFGVTGALLVAAAAACGDVYDESATQARPDSPDASSGSSVDLGEAGRAPTPGAPTASGVVLVHAAAFPAFRLCFENMPELPPQPDSKIMPEANVVGVEVGSVVRIDPLEAPGRIYVINERDVRGTDLACGELLNDPSKKLLEDTHYHVANTIKEPLGQGRVDVLAITGCGAKAFLNHLKTDETNCDKGASRPWDVTRGNLEARVITLEPSPVGATESSLPVQLVHLAPKLDAFIGDAGTLEVTFGNLRDQGALPQRVANQVPLLGMGSPVTLQLNQKDLGVYGTHGFRIAVREGTTTKLEVDRSLAAVQELSSPRDTPDAYYRTPSNYALLLLGDPSAPPGADGGPVASRRQVQLLAIPVLDPSQIEQGADAGSDEGDGGAP
jgi:hypothetical protein